jgi:hypothetical protein
MLALALGWLAACGGPGRPTPTALPPSVARSEQPAPVFANSPQAFRVTPPPAPPRAGQVGSAALATPVTRATPQLPAEQNPTALGIARAPVSLYAAPDGQAVATLPGGGTLTVTGRSADGAWLAVYTAAGVPGWVQAAALQVYGGDDLLVVERAIEPGAMATLLAKALTPVPLPQAYATSAPARPALQQRGTVIAAEGTAVRQRPAGDSAVLAQVDAGATLTVLGRSPDALWLVVVPGRGVGWVRADALSMDTPVTGLPVVQP